MKGTQNVKFARNSEPKPAPIEVASAGRRAANSASAESGVRRGLFAPRLSASELALITRQLATLVASALPLDECLQAAAEQTRKASTKALLLQVRSKVAEGHTLAHAMAQFPKPLVICIGLW